MEGDKVRLTVMGLSYNPIRDGAYALILAQINGPYRIPVVIGSPEAQSIAVCLEKIVTPRPLTHDLFTTLGHVYGITLEEVFIYSFDNGIFSAMMKFVNETGDRVELDSRTSDAIAVALRMNAPIYTTREIMEETGFILEKKGPGKGVASGHNSDGIEIEIEWNEDGSNELIDEAAAEAELFTSEAGNILHTSDLDHLPTEYIEQLLETAVQNEDYETAKLLKSVIDKRNNKDSQS